jgi:hypothetical protein
MAGKSLRLKFLERMDISQRRCRGGDSLLGVLQSILNHDIEPSSPNSEIRLAPKLKALVALSTLR